MGTDGERGASIVGLFMRSEEFVFKLSWLGFRFMAGMVGLIKETDGDAGSEVNDDESELKGG